MFGFGKTTKDPLADAKSAERWLASFPAGDPLAVHGELLSELARITRPRRAPYAGAARGGVRPRRRNRRASAHADRAVHRARESQQQDREPALVVAVRPDAGVPGRLPGVRARGLGARRLEQMAADAARADRTAGRAPGPGREDPALPLRAMDPGRSGRSCTRCSRSPARVRSSASCLRSTRAAARRRSSTNTCSCSCCSSCTPGMSPRSISSTSPSSFPNGARRCVSRSRRRR